MRRQACGIKRIYRSGPQNRPLDPARSPLQEAPGQRFELLGKVGEVHLETPVGTAGSEQVEAFQFAAQVLGAGGGGVHQPQVRGQQVAEHRDQQRILGG